MATEPSADEKRAFFAWSDRLDYEVLRPLSHIRSSWEAIWSHEEQRYEPEDNSFAHELNQLIDQIAMAPRPASYHDHEDIIANHVVARGRTNIRKEGSQWAGEDYFIILQEGGLDDLDQVDLELAATGRVCAAIEHGQDHFDKMETGHRRMLCEIMSLILYHRCSEG